jgi:hypothetical protein
MGVVITPQSKIDEYFESDALSQSQLKKLLGGTDSYINSLKEEKTMFYEEKGHFIIGSAVDTILTGEADEFKKQYYVTTLEKKPSDVEMSIIQFILNDVTLKADGKEITELAQYPGSIQASIEEHAWQANWKMETKINKIVECGSEYFEDLKKGAGKQILSSAESKLIEDIAFSLRSNPRTSKFFDRTALSRAEGVTVYYQLPIYFYYRGIYCKALLDLLIVIRDASGKIISVQALDLKTMNGSTIRFSNNLKSFRYDIQASWYTEAILSPDSNFELAGQITEDILKPFTFIVESNNYPGQPLVFELEQEVLDVGKFGRKDLKARVPGDDYSTIVVRATIGFDELLDTYIYQNENEWKEEEIITKNNGVLKLDWNGIKQ